MWYASALNLWLKYRSKTVDLVRLKRTCTVNDKRAKRDPSRKGGGDLLKGCGSSPTPIVLRRRGYRDPKEAKTLRPLPILLGLGAAGSFAAAIIPGSNGEVRPARGRACGCGVVRLDGRVASPYL
jgi:hypothetical protein